MPTPENEIKKLWLKRYREMDAEMNRRCEELARWQSRATRITTYLSQAPTHGGSFDSMADMVAKIIEIENEINSEIDEMQSVKKEVQSAIDQVPGATLRMVLGLRYIDGMKWEQIAVKMNYSYMQICRLHGEALGKIKML